MSTTANRFIRRIAFGSVAALACLLPVTAQGGTPQVCFDFPHAVECRDVTSQEFARLYPDEKIVEATFRVSARIVEGREADLSELVVEISSFSERMRVAEFLPATTLETDLVGETEIKETRETIGRQGLSIGAAFPIPYGHLTMHGSPSADIGRTQRNTRTVTTKTIPPGQLVVSSGTIHNEHGVFFRLRPTRDTALEDVHEFIVRFVVPQLWRGDWVQLTCRSNSIQKWISFSQAPPREASICQGLHLAGDIESKQAAHRLAHAQLRFLESNRQTARRSLSSSFSRFVESTQARGSACLSTFGLDQAADWLSPPSGGERINPGDSPTIELEAARDAMSAFGREVVETIHGPRVRSIVDPLRAPQQTQQ